MLRLVLTLVLIFAAPISASISKLLRTNRNKRINSQYIVSFSHDVVDVAGKVKELLQNTTAVPVHSIGGRDSSYKGFVVSGLRFQVLQKILADSDVIRVEEDAIVEESFVESSTPSWGLDRIDQRALPLDGTYDYRSTGVGCEVYILDGGVFPSHKDFGGRASCPYSVIANESCIDQRGHGTHVAGTVAGNTYGVAKNATIIGIKVLRNTGRGSVGSAIAGISLVLSIKQSKPATPMVINMSLGGSNSSSLNAAVDSAVAAGIVVVVAAGNDAIDACLTSPASAEGAITVGATGSDDHNAGYSNYGPCVNIFAPGNGITSAGISSDTASAIKSGTSMASPHVAGVAALYLGLYPSWTPAQVRKALLGHAVPTVIHQYANTTNLLVNSQNKWTLPERTCSPMFLPCNQTTQVDPATKCCLKCNKGGFCWIW